VFAATEPSTAGMIVGLAAIPVLVAINGFFVAAEFALVAVRKTRVEELVKNGRARAPALKTAVENLDDSVAAAQLGITVASLALGFVSEPALHKLLAPLFGVLPPGWQGPVSHDGSVHSVDELRLLIEDTEEAGLIDAEQADFVKNVFALSDKTVVDCMVPKEKMTGLDVRAKREEILALVRDSGHTRLPVWEDSPDNIIGVVNTKELVFLFMGNNPLFVLDDMLYPATFFLPTVTVADALRTFKKTHKPMGVVRDADKNVMGLITLEDVIEQIVGDIEDEHDVKVSKLIRRVPRRGMRGRP
jgi:CBS domain containing-hemolysin-like protein